MTPQLTCHVLDTGYCLASEHTLLRGGARRTIHCHALVALLHHPEHGWLLWDTGYAPHMWRATERMPYRMYRSMTPLRLDPQLAIAAQLPHYGLIPNDIKRVLISHFHADHVAGLRDFPNAELIATQRGYDDVRPRRGMRALLRGFVPALLPTDFAQRATLLPPFGGPELPPFGPTHDLFNDGSIKLMALPGHARGQIGMLAHTTRGPILFAADGAWLTQAIRERRPPARSTYMVVDDARAVEATLDRLHEFSVANPDVTIIPTHCPQAYAREVGE